MTDIRHRCLSCQKLIPVGQIWCDECFAALKKQKQRLEEARKERESR